MPRPLPPITRPTTCSSSPSFTFEDGTTLPHTMVSYGTYGRLNARKDNVILLPSSYMADHHDNDWLIGPGLALDTTRYFLVATELFGNGHSSSPSNTPEPYHGPRFPAPPFATTSRRCIACWWTAARHPPGGGHRLLDGGRAGVSVGGELSRLQRPHRRAGRHGPVLAPRQSAARSGDRGHRERHSVPGRRLQHAAETGRPSLRPVWAGWLTSQQWWHDELWKGPRGRRATATNRWSRYSSDSLFAALDANDLILQAATWQHHDVGATPGFQGNVERALALDPCARALHAGADRPVLPGLRRACGGAVHPRVELTPIPSLWGHVAGGGGDEAAKPFINEKVAVFLKTLARNAPPSPRPPRRSWRCRSPTRVANGVLDHVLELDLTGEFLHDDRHHLVVAIDDGVIIGFVSGVHYVHPDKPAELWINEVNCSSSAARNRPADAADHVSSRYGPGCHQAWVLTNRSNTSAMKLYGSVEGIEDPEDTVMFTFNFSQVEPDVPAQGSPP